MKRAALLLLLFLAPAIAYAQQGNVRQSGLVTPGHAAMWTTDGIIQDGCTAGAPCITNFGIISNLVNSFCIDSGPITGPYLAFCLGVNSLTGAHISLTPHNGATNRPINIDGGTGVVVGSATGGAEGVGTVNATGLYINGVPVGGSSGSGITNITVSGGLTGGGTTPTVNIGLPDDIAFWDHNQSWTKAQRGVPVTLTDGATITPDFNAGNNYKVTLAGNRTLANPTNIVAGQAGQITVTQDATGSRTLAFGSDYKFSGGSAPTLTPAANSIDILSYYVIDSTHIAVSPLLNFQ
jgi:hypothetical protein